MASLISPTVVGTRLGCLEPAGPATAIAATVDVPHGFLADSGDGAIWVGGNQTGMVSRVDPATNKIVATIKINDPATTPALPDAGIVTLAAGNDQVWATDRVNKAVVRIDPTTNRATASLTFPQSIDGQHMVTACGLSLVMTTSCTSTASIPER